MPKPKDKEWSDVVEEAVRGAVERLMDEHRELREMSEHEYCSAVAEGIDAYLFGVKARLEEIDPEDE
jgi:hypothetical protein